MERGELWHAELGHWWSCPDVLLLHSKVKLWHVELWHLEMDFCNFWHLNLWDLSIERILEFLNSMFNMLLDVMNLVFSQFFDHVDIIVNLILNVRSQSLESLIKWSEWAAWVCWPCGSSSINNVIDLFLNAFVGNFFLGIKSDIESKLLGVNLSSII